MSYCDDDGIENSSAVTMTAPYLTEDRRITLKDILGWCQEFNRHYGAWPRFKSTAEEFAEAGVHGISGADINRVLKGASHGLAEDPDFLEVRKLALRHMLWEVDLSFIDPVRRRQLLPAELEHLAMAIAAPALVEGAQASSHTISVHTPWRTRGTGRVAFEGLLQRYVEESGMVYGSEPATASSHYYLEVLESGRVYMRYQSIIGSRYVGEFSPEVLRQMREGFDGEVIAQASVSVRLPAPATSVQGELASLSVNGQMVVLPAQHLKFYGEIKQRLEKAGGRYVQGKQQFIFEDGVDVADVVRRLVDGEVVNFQQQYQFFATPPEQAERAVDQLVEQLGTLRGKRILEPSAGDGALADAARRRGAEVVTIEAWNVNAIKLRAKGYQVIEKDFLTVSPREIGTFDAVLANPPFTKDQDIQHVMHMLQFIRPGGALSTIMSTGWQTGTSRRHVQFREFLAGENVEFTPIDAGAFKHAGTTVPTIRLDLRVQPVPGMDDDPDLAEECAEAPAM